MAFCPECGGKNLEELDFVEGLRGKKDEGLAKRGGKWALYGASAGFILPGIGTLMGAALGGSVGVLATRANHQCKDCGHRW